MSESNSEFNSDQSGTDDSEDENENQCQVDDACVDNKETVDTVMETSNPTFNYESSSGDENDEHCPICLLRFKLQPIGRPEKCAHVFCLACITEWAKVRRNVKNLTLVILNFLGDSIMPD